MATSGMDRLFISVPDIGGALAVFRDITGMKVVTDRRPAPREVQRLWKLPGGSGARVVSLRMGTCSTLVTLVEFSPPAGREIRRGTEADTYGIQDLAFRVVNIDAAARYLRQKGYRLQPPPYEYKPVFAPYAVKQGLFLGPGNAPLSIIERMLGQPQGEDWSFTHIGDSAQVVESLKDALHFYVDLLGLDLMVKESVPAGLISPVLGVGPEVTVELAIANRKDSAALMVEFLEVSARPGYPAVPACPPNRGLFMLSFQVDNLDAMLGRLAGEGLAPWSGPVELDPAAWGMGRACVVQGPARVLVCLFEGKG